MRRRFEDSHLQACAREVACLIVEHGIGAGVLEILANPLAKRLNDIISGCTPKIENVEVDESLFNRGLQFRCSSLSKDFVDIRFYKTPHCRQRCLEAIPCDE